ncbi:alpha/beta fold hydrolase [Paraoerskovia sediminicola]|uniref:alpha/beta fold hydrolase n=1 Tax=Paraoerskovia sediminicola TaxID=1138587 RepID=UPI0025732CCC|nr:alpha/beta hydrolase [Paraoerskovia sediminicola]
MRTAATPSDPRAVVLYLHGYNDYFFQAHLAEAFTDAGYAFYALDARRCGRSLRDGDVPHYQDDLHEQANDLSNAVRVLRQRHPGVPLVVNAHSTGGLVASLWAHSLRDAGVPDALVLNSPFLDIGASRWLRAAASRVVDLGAQLAPQRPLTSAPSYYATYQHVSAGGRWTFDTELKRTTGVPARAGWVRAVLRGQARIARRLAISCPVLVARSDASGPDSPTNPDLDRQDTVLNVANISRDAPLLGDRVDELVVEGGVHDLVLSAAEPRAAYLEGVLAWLDGALAPGVREPAVQTGTGA